MPIKNDKIYTSLCKRIIPVILFYNYQIVKSRHFDDYRTFGNLEQTITVFNKRRVDELVILDIGASKHNYEVNVDILSVLSKNSLMPITFGGGVSTLTDIQNCLSAGCDKVVINSECLRRPDFIKEASRIFGTQCIVVSVDFTTNKDGSFQVFSHAGIDTLGLVAQDFIIKLSELGAGEIILTSVDRDGSFLGYELSILKDLTSRVEIPILINGGCGEPKHMAEAFQLGAEGVLAGSIFYYTEYGYRDIKLYLSDAGFTIRIPHASEKIY